MPDDVEIWRIEITHPQWSHPRYVRTTRFPVKYWTAWSKETAEAEAANWNSISLGGCVYTAVKID